MNWSDLWTRILNLFQGKAETALDYALGITALLLAIMAVVSLTISIILAIKYIRFNRRKNSANISGFDAARKILDDNGLKNIGVKVTGSFIFGNSYSHYFHKVRLRRFTRKKTSITSLAMGSQKASLAILDKEGDKDMKKRIILTPIVFFGPLAFVPLIAAGIILDIVLKYTTPTWTIIFACIGMALFICSFFLSFLTLKTEKKAQVKAMEILKKENLATDEEIQLMKDLFKLYNIEYINDMIISALEIIYYALSIASSASNSTSKN